MPHLREVWDRLRGVFRRARSERELDAELRSHIELAIAANLRRGMSPGEARRAALVRLGGIEQTKQAWRDQRGLPWLEIFARDLRYALRLLARSPGFTAIAIATLALGIGANTVMFAVADGVMLRPLPYPASNRIVFIREQPAAGHSMSLSMPDYEDLVIQNHTFAQMAAFDLAHALTTAGGEPVLLLGARVSAAFFKILGAKTVLGRTFAAEDDRPGAPPVVVLTYGYWQGRLGGDRAILGRSLILDDKAYTVIGILSPDFEWVGYHPDFYWPIGLRAATPAMTNRGQHASLSAIGRLRPRVSLAAARADLNEVMARLASEYPATNRGHDAFIEPISEYLFGEVAPTLWILLAAVGVVLLIACVNLANLELARGSARPREFSIRAALGAGQLRILSQLLTESLVLAAAGGAAGLLLAAVAIGPLLRLAPQDIPGVSSSGIPRLMSSGIDGRVLFFNFTAAILAAILFGLGPALRLSRAGLAQRLQESGRATWGRPHERLRAALLVGEMALSVVLVVAAGLMLRSLARAVTTDPGFDPGHLLALDVVMSGPKYGSGSPAARRVLVESLGRLRGLPEAASAGATLCPPLVGDCWDYFYSIPGRPAASGELEDAEFNLADPGYFRTLRASLVAGRDFTEADTADSEPIAIINEAMARMWWGNVSPIGQQLRYGDPAGKGKVYRIVGVVADVRQDGMDIPQMPEAYFPFEQRPPAEAVVFILRARGDPESLVSAATAAIHAADPDLPVRVHPMSVYVAASLARRKFITLLLGLFSTLALGLAILGVYGVISFNVARRTQEIGVRMALGAAPRQLLGAVVGAGARLALVGVAIGCAGALALTRAMTSLLYGVSATDPLTFAAAAATLFAVALAACAIPARRAARIDPMSALRHE